MTRKKDKTDILGMPSNLIRFKQKLANKVRAIQTLTHLRAHHTSANPPLRKNWEKIIYALKKITSAALVYFHIYWNVIGF